MPELPEVHTTATMLDKLVKGLRIVSVWTDYNSLYHKGNDNIKDPKFFKSFSKQVIGGKFTRVHRRGKNILMDLDNGQTIIVHMKMTGHVLYGAYRKVKSKSEKGKIKEEWVAEEKGPLGDFRNQFIHLVISLSNGKHLALSDMRKFAKVTVVPTSNIETTGHLKDIGPEPLDPKFSFEKFRARLLTKPRGKIKQVLMNPEVVAGVGNIYSDEILYAASVHPLSTVGKIPEKISRKIFSGMKDILAKGIDFGGDSTSDYRNPLGEFGKFHHHHQAYRNTGKPCGKKGCRGVIRRLKLGGRSAHFCSIHQREYN